MNFKNNLDKKILNILYDITIKRSNNIKLIMDQFLPSIYALYVRMFYKHCVKEED